MMASSPPRQHTTPYGRFYEIADGELVPSVTHILQAIAKPALIQWAANQERTLVIETAADLYGDLARTPPMSRLAYVTTLAKRVGTQKAHQKILARAGDIGTQIHHLIEWNLRRQLGQTVGPEPRVVDDAQWAFMAYQDWAKDVTLTPLLIEQIVWSRTHRYAGTMDLLAEVNGVITLVDFKSGKAIYPEAHVQNVAYQVALSDMGQAQPAAGLIVRLPKQQSDPEFEAAPVPPVTELFPTFLAIYDVWRWWYQQDSAYRQKGNPQLKGQ